MDVYGYFKSYHDYFWQWEEEGEVLATSGGNTIAYKKYIIELLQNFSGQGFPPFGTLLMLLIATNPNGADALNAIYSVLNKDSDHNSKVILDNANKFLKLISEVPESYKKGAKRIILLQSLFHEFQHRRLSPKNSLKILDAFRLDAFLKSYILEKSPRKSRTLSGDFRILSLLGDKFRSVTDILAAISSLPEIPEELDINSEPKKETEKEDLIEQLTEDDRTFRIGTLIKRIWSGLNIPVHSNMPSAQPLGGVSDLSNKGTFDRLLISEFANDDLLFLSRIANNEALYIHREIPPVSNNQQRIILVDISLKNWGTPKIIAYAIALAIAKHPKTDIACTAFAFGNSFYPLALDTVDNIVDSLQLLDNGLHGVQGLDTFFKAYPDNRNREIFLIAATSTLNQVAVVKALNDYFSTISYWIHTDAEGNIDLYKKQQKSRKHVQHMRLPLNELWVKVKKPEIPKNLDTRIVDYPILFKDLPNPKKVFSTYDKEIFQLTRENTLLRYVGPANKQRVKGWQLIFEGIPQDNIESEIAKLENGDYALLLYLSRQKEVVLINISDNTINKVPFPEWDNGKFIYFQNEFYYLDRNSGWSFNLQKAKAKSGESKLMKTQIKQERFDEIINKCILSVRQEALASLSKYSDARGGSPIQRFTEVYINTRCHLVFNTHELHITNGNHLKLSKLGNLIKETLAPKTSDTTFTFNDGSVIETIRTGLIILKSSNTHIPTIYIPAAVDTVLGIATYGEFAGNLYYHREYREPTYNIILIDSGPNRLRVIDILRQFVVSNLETAKEYAISTPVRIAMNYSLNQVNNLKGALETQGAKVTIVPGNIWDNPDFEANKIIELHDFFNKYVQAFINHVLSYETSH